MLTAIFLLLFSLSSWSRPLVLVGHFDAFDKAPFNNSEKIAKLLLEKVKDHPDFDLKLCALNTVFDKSTDQLEDCLKALPETPRLILGLGESNCNFKIETMGRNFDKTFGPDNEGNERENTTILSGADKAIGLNYPLAQMYCSLPKIDRSDIEVSNDAGTFVCNNLAFQFAHLYQDLTFGFIHVPSHHCRNLAKKDEITLRNLETMITTAVKTTTFERLATRKKEIEVFRENSKNDQCLSEFYKRTKGVDEKSFWTFSVPKNNRSYTSHP